MFHSDAILRSRFGVACFSNVVVALDLSAPKAKWMMDLACGILITASVGLRGLDTEDRVTVFFVALGYASSLFLWEGKEIADDWSSCLKFRVRDRSWCSV